MKIIARGFTSGWPEVAPDPVTVVTLKRADDYDNLVSARTDLWWECEFRPSWVERHTAGLRWWWHKDEDRLGRWSGYALALTGLLALLGLAGWIEGGL